jgi:hypothetical protein
MFTVSPRCVPSGRPAKTFPDLGRNPRHDLAGFRFANAGSQRFKRRLNLRVQPLGIAGTLF